MRALLLSEIGTSPAIQEVPDLAAGAGKIVVAIKAASLNHRELWIQRGQYPGMVLPATLGADGAGVVESVGTGVNPALVGQEVVLYPGLEWGDDPRYPVASFGLLGMPGPGTIAEKIVVSAESAFSKPAHLDAHQAAAIPLAGLTAWRGLITKAGLQPDERVLITGVGGGVAAQALAFAVAMGAEAWVTSGSDETLAWAMARGAAGGVNYKSEDWGKTLGKAAGPINVVFDGAPASGYAAYGRALAMGARVVVYGSTGGLGFQVSAPELFLKNVTVAGTNVGNRQEFGAMLDFVSRHKLVPEIERVFSFDQATDALTYLESSHARGKVVIDVKA